MNSIDELLRGGAPTANSAPDWQDVLRRSRASLGWRAANRIVPIGVVLMLAAVAVPALALSSTVQRLVGLSAREGPITAQAHLILEAPAGDDVVVRLYSAPSSQGGECEFTQYAKAGAPANVPVPNGGGWCRSNADATQSQAPESTRSHGMMFSVSVSPTSVGATLEGASTGPHVVISGSVAPSLQSASVMLEGPRLSERLHTNDNHFLGATDSIYRPSADELPLNVVAYDTAGREVARERIPAASLDPDA